MPRPESATRSFTAGEAKYILERLIKDRRIRASEAAKIADEMPGEIATLERRLAELRGPTGPRRSGGGGSTRRATGRRSSGLVSAKTAESRRIQGEYMGLLRYVTGRDRAAIKTIAKEQGREAAIREMRAARSM